MSYRLLTAMLIAALPGAAFAQSTVTVYGIVDAAVAVEDTGVDGGIRRVVNSGNQSTSRFGFRGTEELGGGLRAMFNLEGGYGVDTGLGDAALFGRRAVVGLQGTYGLLTVGREYTPVADVAKATDIMGLGFFGGARNSFTTGRLTRRISNSVNFRSNAFQGLRVTAAHGLGETLTGPSLDLTGVGLDYTLGKLKLAAAYQVFERLLAGKDKEWVVGAAYALGTLEFKGNYLVADREGSAQEFKQANLGVSKAFGSNTVYFNAQRSTQGSAKGNGYALAASHALSKRTNAYATYATIANNASATFGINSAGTNVTPPSTAFGADPAVLTVGIRHQF